ncbi:MAG TPA: thiazolylpeptide-type bacteriocin, partial [Candidatus Nocardiopsis merdipullorum]|nr:thiazolylpeptide-type bacteriocin [Candidatus Nocardiopsis merdipullorum]
MKIGDIHGLRHELEQLESETFEVLDFVDSPEEMLAGTTSTSS